MCIIATIIVAAPYSTIILKEKQTQAGFDSFLYQGNV